MYVELLWTKKRRKKINIMKKKNLSSQIEDFLKGHFETLSGVLGMTNFEAVGDRERLSGTERGRSPGTERGRSPGTERERMSGTERERMSGTERGRSPGTERESMSGTERERMSGTEAADHMERMKRTVRFNEQPCTTIIFCCVITGYRTEIQYIITGNKSSADNIATVSGYADSFPLIF
jgi:hypothetical protein